jgi:hypothetical protein
MMKALSLLAGLAAIAAAGPASAGQLDNLHTP